MPFPFSYNYDNKYFAILLGRRFSKFSKDTRWVILFLWRSWIISNEPFIDEITWLDYLEQNFHMLVEIIEAWIFIFSFDTGYNQLDNTGVISSQFVDPNLTWEKTALLNFGTEFG